MFEGDSVKKGLLIGFGITVLGLGLLFALKQGPLATIGLAQLLWIIPLYIAHLRTGAPETAKGILIFSGVVLLLSGVYCGKLLIDSRLAGALNATRHA